MIFCSLLNPRPYQAAYGPGPMDNCDKAEAQQKLNNLNLARADELRAKNVIAKQDYDNAVSQKKRVRRASYRSPGRGGIGSVELRLYYRN